jgi:hypothetical protein
MDMGANFLPEISRTENPNNRNPCGLQGWGRLNIVAKRRIMAAGQSLIVINAI